MTLFLMSPVFTALAVHRVLTAIVQNDWFLLRLALVLLKKLFRIVVLSSFSGRIEHLIVEQRIQLSRVVRALVDIILVFRVLLSAVLAHQLFLLPPLLLYVSHNYVELFGPLALSLNQIVEAFLVRDDGHPNLIILVLFLVRASHHPRLLVEKLLH